MKRLQLILVLLICAGAGMGQQLSLSGTVKGGSRADSLEVNVSYDGNYWKKNSVYLKPDASGRFHFSFPGHTERFIMLLYKSHTQRLLLSPDRPLHVQISTSSAQPVFSFSGKAKPENDLVQKLKLEDEGNLPFIRELKLKDSYAHWSVDSVMKIRLPLIRHSLDSTEQLVHQAKLPQSLKKAIAAEVKYLYANAISRNLGDLLNTRKDRINYLRFIDTVLTEFTVPAKETLDINISANTYLDNYFRLKTWKGMYTYAMDADKVHAGPVFKDNMGFEYQTMMADPDISNEAYFFSTRMKNAAPPYAWEKHLANLLFNFCMSGQLQSADKLLHFIRANCLTSQYVTASEEMFSPLRKAREQYASNLNIRIRPDYRTITSVKSLLAPYKGKVVFVDMWGTWCPHCIEDMAYEPQLKKRFEGREVVFLYVAMDEDKDDEKWRDFIFINNLTGEHVRRTGDQIGPLWNELGIIDSEQAYPHYFVFDRSGEVAVRNAGRPGEGEVLYSQIEAALNK